jgi:ABC-type nitrate/sulfonate/bicarbonate transport system substrate-binding protein
MTEARSTRRCVLGLAVGGFGLSIGLRRARAEEVSGTLNVSTFKQTSYLAGYYLERFAPPGLKINIVETKSNGDAVDALATGNTDVGYMGAIACAIAASRGRPIRAVASVGSKTTRLMVRKDSPYKTVADLKGKTVAIAKLTNQDIILRELLKEAGLNPKTDVDYILVPTESQAEALANKTVEATICAEPPGSILLLNGIGRELVSTDKLNSTPVGNPGVLVALSTDTITKRPALAQAFVTMHAKTTIWMRHNVEQLVKDFSKMSRQREDVIRMAMSNTAHHYDMNEDYLRRVEVLNDDLVEAGYLGSGYHIRDAFDTRFLPAARASAGEVV